MVQSSKEHALEDQDIQKLIDACKTDVEKYIITTLVYTGMRAEELAMMRKSWIKWQDEVIQIPSEDPETGWKPKTRNGARRIPIIDPILNANLKAWFHFNDETGFHRTSIWRIVTKVARRANLQTKVYPHSLRATYASRLAAMNMSPTTIQQALGWSMIKTAESYVKSSGARMMHEFREKWKA